MYSYTYVNYVQHSYYTSGVVSFTILPFLDQKYLYAHTSTASYIAWCVCMMYLHRMVRNKGAAIGHIMRQTSDYDASIPTCLTPST